jgi:hypothetical protein
MVLGKIMETGIRKILLEEILGTIKEGMLVNTMDLVHGFKTLEEARKFRTFIKQYYSISYINPGDANLLNGDIATEMRFLRGNAQAIFVKDKILILEVLDSSFCKILIEEEILYMCHAACRLVLVK